MPKQNEGPVGLCATPYALAAAQVLVGGDRSRIRFASVISPNNLYQNNEITDSTLLQSAIKRLAGNMGIHLSRAVVSITEPGMVTQITKIPLMPREDLPEAIQSLAEQYAIFNDEEVAADFVVLDEIADGASKKQAVFLAAAKQPLIDIWDESLFALGAALHVAEPAVISILRAQYTAIQSSEAIASLVIDRESSQINIFQDGILRVSYKIEIGIPSLGIGPSQKASDLTSEERYDENETGIIPKNLLAELRNALRFFQIQCAPVRCEKILLITEHQSPTQLASRLADELGIEIELFDARNYWDFDETSLRAIQEANPVQVITAIGLALRDEISSFPLQLNLRQWPEMPQPGLKIPLITASVLAIAILGGSLLMSSALSWKIKEAKVKSAELTPRIQIAQETLGSLEQQQQENQQTEMTFQNEINQVLAKSQIHWSGVLYQISSQMPKDVWLTKLYTKGSELQLEGIAKNNRAIADYVSALNQSKSFNYVMLSSIETQPNSGGKKAMQFIISAQMNP